MNSFERPPWNPARRCTAMNRAGLRCLRQPLPGGEVCVMHGGRAPQVQHSARMRLVAGADLAIDYLINLLTPRPPCEHCGRSDADRDPTVVKACQLVLDRSGFHPTLTVEQVAPPALNGYEDLTDDEVIEKLERMLASARASRDRQQLRLGEGAVDALVIDEGFLIPEGDDAPPAAPNQQADDPNPDGNGTPEKRTEG